MVDSLAYAKNLNKAPMSGGFSPSHKDTFLGLAVSSAAETELSQATWNSEMAFSFLSCDVYISQAECQPLSLAHHL